MTQNKNHVNNKATILGAAAAGAAAGVAAGIAGAALADVATRKKVMEKINDFREELSTQGEDILDSAHHHIGILADKNMHAVAVGAKGGATKKKRATSSTVKKRSKK